MQIEEGIQGDWEYGGDTAGVAEGNLLNGIR